MAARVSLHQVFTHIVCIITIFSSFTPTTQQVRPYDYYTFSVHWPKTFCKTSFTNVEANRPGFYVCRTPNQFTIFNLSPMYHNTNNPGSGRTIMVPWYKNDNRCIEATVTPIRLLKQEYLTPIVEDLDTYWPNLVKTIGPADHDNMLERRGNMGGAWVINWNNHGMCFDRPDKPIYYFVRPLLIIQTYNFKDILAAGGITPQGVGGTGYPLLWFSNIINNALGGGVWWCTIYCQSSGGVYYLSQIRLCYDRKHNLMICPTKYSNCPREDWNTTLLLYPSVSD